MENDAMSNVPNLACDFQHAPKVCGRYLFRLSCSPTYIKYQVYTNKLLLRLANQLHNINKCWIEKWAS